MTEFDRSGKAKALLENPLFLEAFQTVEAAIHDKWASIPTHNEKAAHELKLMLSVLKNVRRAVEKVAQEGRKPELRLVSQRTVLGDLWPKKAK
jgi:hypothetical protein